MRIRIRQYLRKILPPAFNTLLSPNFLHSLSFSIFPSKENVTLMPLEYATVEGFQELMVGKFLCVTFSFFKFYFPFFSAEGISWKGMAICLCICKHRLWEGWSRSVFFNLSFKNFRPFFLSLLLFLACICIFLSEVLYLSHLCDF